MSDTIDLTAAQKHLDAFLVENQELETLTARLSAFNLFHVLRVDQVEIRHSNVLAWLLSPDGSHGLGAVFLRRFLSRLLLEHDEASTKLTPAQFELMNFADVEVLREWQHIDLLVRSPTKRWCLLIENKIKSKESKGQLTRYMERVSQEMPDYEVIPVYLTLEGDAPSEAGLQAGFLPLSHLQVLELAEQIISQHRSRIPDDAHTFLTHYLETLRRLTMQDEELVDLCKTIYRKHREAIDLIVDLGASSNVLDACMTAVESLVECEYVVAKRGGIRFLPQKLGKNLGEPLMNGWGYLPRNTPIVFWTQYQKRNGSLAMVMEVGPIADSAMRIELLKAVQAAGIEFSAKGLSETAKFTRLRSASQKLKLDEEGEPDLSEEEIGRVVKLLWAKFEEPLAKVVEAVDGFAWE